MYQLNNKNKMNMKNEDELKQFVEEALTRRMHIKNKSDAMSDLFNEVNKNIQDASDNNEMTPKYIEVMFKHPKFTVMAILYHHYIYGEIFNIGNGRLINYSDTPTEKLLDNDIENLESAFFSDYTGLGFSESALYSDTESEFKLEFEGFNIKRYEPEMPKILSDCVNDKFHESLIETARKDPQKFNSIIYIYENNYESFNKLVIEPGLANMDFSYPTEFDMLMKRTYPHFTNWIYCFIEMHGRKDFLDFIIDLESEIHNYLIREIIENYPKIEDVYDSVYLNDYSIIDIRHSKIVLFEMPYTLSTFFPLLSLDAMENMCIYRFF
jgi:hypothetical protein